MYGTVDHTPSHDLCLNENTVTSAIMANDETPDAVERGKTALASIAWFEFRPGTVARFDNESTEI
jgi:hypothetical protein